MYSVLPMYSLDRSLDLCSVLPFWIVSFANRSMACAANISVQQIRSHDPRHRQSTINLCLTFDILLFFVHIPMVMLMMTMLMLLLMVLLLFVLFLDVFLSFSLFSRALFFSRSCSLFSPLHIVPIALQARVALISFFPLTSRTHFVS